MGDAVLNIFKVLANLDITEKRKPQDGSFSAKVEGRDVDFRVATPAASSAKSWSCASSTRNGPSPA